MDGSPFSVVSCVKWLCHMLSVYNNETPITTIALLLTAL